MLGAAVAIDSGDIWYKIDKCKMDIHIQVKPVSRRSHISNSYYINLKRRKSLKRKSKMFKIALLFTLFAVTLAGVIHEHSGEYEKSTDGDTAETEHHHHVNHKHAESHQSVKFIHYHAVPVYVKKEDQKYLHHPVEIGSNKHKLKLVHPETEHAKGHGLTLENHSEYKSHKIEHAPHHDHHSAGSESHEAHEVYEQQPEFDFQAFEAAHH